jgi:D-glucuronyl C5-epimerase C-terminus
MTPPAFLNSTITAQSVCSTTPSQSHNTAWETTSSAAPRTPNAAESSSSVPTGCARTSSRTHKDSPSGIITSDHFDWEYRDTLRAPWYSALAQGQGISILVRAQKESRDPKYLDAAKRALACFYYPMQEGGVAFTDESGDLWLEEYIVSPPTHILNGFIWASWGIYEYFLATQHRSAQELFSRAVRTMLHNLDRYDLGFWSLYEQSQVVPSALSTRLPLSFPQIFPVSRLKPR